MVKIFSFLGIIWLFIGCSNVGTICPPFPKPSKDVLNKIYNLHDNDVDMWVESVFKHNLKIKVCRGEF